MSLVLHIPVSDWNALKLDDLSARWACEPHDIVKTLMDAILEGMAVKENPEHVEMVVLPETYAVINLAGQLAKIKEREG